MMICRQSQNNSQTFLPREIFEDTENKDSNSCISVLLKRGVIVYISRGNDVKDWVINDLGIN